MGLHQAQLALPVPIAQAFAYFNDLLVSAIVTVSINFGGNYGSPIDFPRWRCGFGGRTAVWPQSWRRD
jgi:hypothetical protein